jgi:hypothetical protein
MDSLKSLFGSQKPSSPAVLEPAMAVSPRVLLFVYDPIVDPASGQKLSQRMSWNRPEDRVSQFVSDILQCSGGLGRYQIVQRIDVNEFPLKADGFRYTAQTCLDVLNRVAKPHNPDTVNYQDFLVRHNILQRVAANQIDEVWVLAFPFAGFYESVMAGSGAFFCNADPLLGTSKGPRRFVIMGFSLERGVGEMLEAFGHRAESIMERVYSRSTAQANMWKKFIRYDKTHPSQAECGNVHFAPNSDKDYDWGNSRTVLSRCDDWNNYPTFKGTVRPVNCAEWGGGDIRAHHTWWLRHMPKAAGRLNGVSNNWWQYILDPNRVTG